MQLTLVLASAFVGLTAAAPQGVTDVLTPTGAAPAGCTGSATGNFEITVAKVTNQKRDLPEKRAECGGSGILVLSLKDGSTFDAQGRTGYIASNYQFQFDAPAQAGALFTSGFSMCDNNILALGDSKTFYQCRSGSFFNLYDRTWAPQCEPVTLIAIPCGADSGAAQSPDGQIVGTTVVQTTIVTALTDGQPQVITTSVPIPVYTTYAPVSEYTDGQIQVTPTGVPVSEYTDGQVQVTPTGAVSVPQSTSTPAPVTSSSEPASSTPVVIVTPPATSASEPATTPASSYSASTPAVSSPATTPADSSSAPAPSSSAPPATTSAPATGGSSQNVAAGSVGALVVAVAGAFLYL